MVEARLIFATEPSLPIVGYISYHQVLMLKSKLNTVYVYAAFVELAAGRVGITKSEVGGQTCHNL